MKNLGQMMKQAQQMQAKMAELQAALDQAEVTGQSGGGMVTITTSAKGDPKKVFGRQVAAKLPDTDAVDFCAARIHAANSCGNFVRINRVYALGSQVSEQEAQITGEI